MVTLEWEGDALIIRPQGLYRLWSARQRIVVQRTQLRHAALRASAGLIHGSRGIRMLGLSLPGLLRAGSYYSRRGGWEFWLVGNAKRVVEIELAGHRFQRLILQIDKPAACARKLEAFRLG